MGWEKEGLSPEEGGLRLEGARPTGPESNAETGQAVTDIGWERGLPGAGKVAGRRPVSAEGLGDKPEGVGDGGLTPPV